MLPNSNIFSLIPRVPSSTIQLFSSNFLFAWLTRSFCFGIVKSTLMILLIIPCRKKKEKENSAGGNQKGRPVYAHIADMSSYIVLSKFIFFVGRTTGYLSDLHGSSEKHS
jgi:hypothetical protein